MSTRHRQVESLFEVPSQQLIDVEMIMFESLLSRDIPKADARAAVEGVLERIARRPETFAARLTSLDAHRSYFVDLALAAHLDRLQRERWRRQRELQGQLAFIRTSGTSTRTRPRMRPASAVAGGKRMAS